MTRKDELIDLIEIELEQLEELLINTPPDLNQERYQELIEKAKRLREALRILKNY